MSNPVQTPVRPRHWAAGYIGRPWRREADCRALVRDVLLEHFALHVPALLGVDVPTDFAGVRQAATQQGWRPTADAPAEGDILVVHGADGAHVGVFIQYGPLGVLHAPGGVDKPAGARFDELRDLLASGYSRPQVWRYQP